MWRRSVPRWVGWFVVVLLTACAPATAPLEEREPPEDAGERPADGGGLEPLPEKAVDVPPEEPKESPAGCPPRCPVIRRVEGDGTPRPPTYGGQAKPPDAVEATQRFQTRWLLEGEHLDRLDRLTLVAKNDPSTTYELTWEGERTMNRRSVRLPRTLTAGLFLLVGYIGSTPLALGQTFVLQGEKGDRGDKGDGFDASTLSFVGLLKQLLGSSSPSKLVAAADSIELKAGDASLSLDKTSRTLLSQGANVQITNGSGSTEAASNGYGNLFLGYNLRSTHPQQTGSHNLLLGDEHSFTSHAAILAGKRNSSSAAYASVLASEGSSASGARSAVFASFGGTASGEQSAVFASLGGTASGPQSAVLASSDDAATQFTAEASKAHSLVLASKGGKASGEQSAVLASSGGTASGSQSTVLASSGGTASGSQSTVLASSDGLAAAKTEASGTNSAVIASFGSKTNTFKSNSAVVAAKSASVVGSQALVCGGDSKSVSADNQVLCP